jgi:hypothetical protein
MLTFVNWIHEVRTMRRQLIVVLALYFASIPVFAQSSSPERRDLDAIVASGQEAAIRAVTFRQGDAKGFKRGHPDFTPDGWTEFLKHMRGWLDEKGAPTFSSSFTPSRNAVVIGNENGVVHFRIPGTLIQRRNGSSTTYRAALEVYAFRDMIHGGQAIKIKHLEEITCAGASSACQ